MSEPRVKKIAFVTCRRLPELTADDRLVAAALERRGTRPIPVVWDDSSARWEGFDRIVLRSCWDYHRRLPEFLAWLAAIEKTAVEVWNRPRVIRWNAYKSYLRDLERAGVSVLPTAWFDAGSRVDLSALLESRGWDAAVVKPAVSASAYRTTRTSRSSARGDQPELDAILAEGPALVQVFAPEIAIRGEWSFVFLGGSFSHAVVKRPARGDFRVQKELGGAARSARPSDRLVEQAAALLERVRVPTLYARVDALERGGELVLMELELIEPELFLASDRGAPERFADAILADSEREIRVRRARPEDAGAIARVLRLAFLEHESSYTAAAFAATAPSANEVLERMRQGPVWVAVEEGRVIGTAAAVAERGDVRVRGMAIEPRARRRGVGGRLLDAAEGFAAETGSERIVLSTTPFLVAAIRLYERRGFARSDEPPHDLSGTPLLTMVKILRGRETRACDAGDV